MAGPVCAATPVVAHTVRSSAGRTTTRVAALPFPKPLETEPKAVIVVVPLMARVTVVLLNVMMLDVPVLHW